MENGTPQGPALESVKALEQRAESRPPALSHILKQFPEIKSAAR